MFFAPGIRLGAHEIAALAGAMRLAMCLALAGCPLALDAQELGFATVLERWRAYLETYSEQYSTTIAIERYRQVDGPAQTRLESEFAMVRVSGPERWLGFRDVLRIDGKDVTDRPGRLARVFANPSALSLDLARAISKESARYNIGPNSRTINNPALVLMVLDPSQHHRLQFSKDDEQQIAGVRAWVLRFREEARPTIVRTTQGQDQPIDGRAWIDPHAGTLVRAQVRVDVHEPRRRSGSPVEQHAVVDVEFASEPQLKMWLPSRMREHHTLGTRTLQSGEATYSDYRQFVVQSRVLPPEP